MHVGVRLVGVQHHRVAMPAVKLLPREVANRGEHLLRRRAFRHREHQLVYQLRGFAGRQGIEARRRTQFVEVQTPVVDQLLPDSPMQLIPVVTLQRQVALSTDVVEMPTNGLQVAAAR